MLSLRVCLVNEAPQVPASVDPWTIVVPPQGGDWEQSSFYGALVRALGQPDANRRRSSDGERLAWRWTSPVGRRGRGFIFRVTVDAMWQGHASAAIDVYDPNASADEPDARTGRTIKTAWMPVAGFAIHGMADEFLRMLKQQGIKP